jgi:hypothetical protein
MRHILQAGAVTAGTFGMGKAAAAAGLVTLTRLADRITAGRLCTVRGAVDLAAVAVAANYHLCSATRAEKESTCGLHWRPKSRQGNIDRDLQLVDTLPAPVPGTVWGTTSVWTGWFEPVSCRFLFGNVFLTHLSPDCHLQPFRRTCKPVSTANTERVPSGLIVSRPLTRSGAIPEPDNHR